MRHQWTEVGELQLHSVLPFQGRRFSLVLYTRGDAGALPGVLREKLLRAQCFPQPAPVVAPAPVPAPVAATQPCQDSAMWFMEAYAPPFAPRVALLAPPSAGCRVVRLPWPVPLSGEMHSVVGAQMLDGATIADVLTAVATAFGPGGRAIVPALWCTCDGRPLSPDVPLSADGAPLVVRAKLPGGGPNVLERLRRDAAAGWADVSDLRSQRLRASGAPSGSAQLSSGQQSS